MLKNKKNCHERSHFKSATVEFNRKRAVMQVRFEIMNVTKYYTCRRTRYQYLYRFYVFARALMASPLV